MTTPTLDSLIEMLQSPDKDVRMEAADRIGRLNFTEGQNALIACLAMDFDPRVRGMAALSLGLIGTPEAIPYLESAAQEGPFVVTVAAQAASGKIQERARPTHVHPQQDPIKNLLGTLAPLLAAVRANESDSIARRTPDSSVIWTSAGSWSQPVQITLGDLRRIAQAVNALG